jgi:hypothetical protein
MLPLATGYGWNPATNRYINLETGRFVAASTVRDALESVMEASAARMNAVTQQLVDRQISLASWQTEMMQNIKLSHTAAAASANGGWAQMTQSDWGAAGQMIREQYDYLRNFANQIADGTQPLDGRVLVRADMYGDAARNTFEEMRRRGETEGGMQFERRVLGQADHCPDCLDYAAEGWQPIGTLPQIGDSVCLTRCHCTFEYSDTNPEGGDVTEE